jgi:monoamine oxidase
VHVSKDFTSKYLSALQERHGNVWFASADWADGWRGFIDGAVEQGSVVGQMVLIHLSESPLTAGDPFI